VEFLVLDLARILRGSGIPVGPAEVLDCAQALRALQGRRLERRELCTLLNATLVKAEWGVELVQRLTELFLGPDEEWQGEDFAGALAQGATGEGGASGVPIERLLEAVLSREVDFIHGLCRTLRLEDLLDDREGALERLEQVSGWGEVSSQVEARRPGLTPEAYASARRLLEEWHALLNEELERGLALGMVRERVAELLRRDNPRHLSFTESEGPQVERITRELERLARRLATRKGRRRRAAKAGQVHLRRTLRRAVKGGGVLEHTDHRPSRPDLWLLCDMSNSVRQFSCFMLLFVSILQRRFNRVRSFAFVDRLLEITDDLGQENLSRLRLRGHDLTGYSHYGEVLRQFHVEHLEALTRRTTVIILGDARNNWNSLDGTEVLPEIRGSAAALYWLNPLRREAWSKGDCLMEIYAPLCTAAFPCSNIEQLERLVKAVF